MLKEKVVKPKSISSLSKEEFNVELEKGYQDILNGKTKSANEVFDRDRPDTYFEEV